MCHHRHTKTLLLRTFACSSFCSSFLLATGALLLELGLTRGWHELEGAVRLPCEAFPRGFTGLCRGKPDRAVLVR